MSTLYTSQRLKNSGFERKRRMNISKYFLFAAAFSAILDTAAWGQKSQLLGWFLVH